LETVTLSQMEKKFKFLGHERDGIQRRVRDLRLKSAREVTIVKWQKEADRLVRDYAYLESFLKNAKLELARHGCAVTVSSVA